VAKADEQPVTKSATTVIEGMRLERRLYFALPPVDLFRRWADESGRPLTEKRYSPYRPGAAC